MRKVKVAILGAGTAGLTALGVVRKHTDDFVIVNDGPYGTTCARVGCMPSKALIHVANDYHRRATFDAVGIRGGEGLRMDVAAALAWVRSYRDARVAPNLRPTDRAGERSIAGRATFEAPDVLRVVRTDGGEERVHAEAVIVATGSSPIVPAAWRSFGDRILTTDTLFEQRDLPGRIAVVGLGAIGLEMGQALSRLGLEVTGFELRDVVAALTDPELRAEAAKHFAEEFTLHLGNAVEIHAAGDALRVVAGDHEAEVDGVLAALGRASNVADLGLDRLGLPLDERGLPPFDPNTMQIGDLPIYIAGDVDADRVVMHEASDEGFIAAWNAVHGPTRFRRRTPLAIAFTEPEIAMVGLPHAALPDNAVSAAHDFSRQSRALAMRSAAGLLKVYAEPGSGRLLGAEMMTPHAEHLAHLLALAIEREMTVAEVLTMPVYHPVLEEGLRSALRSLARKAYGEAPLEFRRLGDGAS